MIQPNVALRIHQYYSHLSLLVKLTKLLEEHIGFGIFQFAPHDSQPCTPPQAILWATSSLQPHDIEKQLFFICCLSIHLYLFYLMYIYLCIYIFSKCKTNMKIYPNKKLGDFPNQMYYVKMHIQDDIRRPINLVLTFVIQNIPFK